MLRDASKKEMKYEGPKMMGPGMKEEETFQELCFDSEQLPEMSGWKVGQKYQLIIEVLMKEHSTEMEEDELSEEAEFEVLKVGVATTKEEAARKMAEEKLK